MELKDLEAFKCKTDEILFISYDHTLDPDMTSELLNEVLEFCNENEVACLVIPKNEKMFDVQLEQMDVTRLRKLDERIQSEIKKKSKVIL